MHNLAILRNLYAQQQYQALQEACLTEDQHQFSIQILSLLACVNLGELEGIEEKFQLILQHEAELDHDALCDLSAAFIVRSQLDEAMLRLQYILGQQAEHALALARLALCHLMLNETEAAVQYFARSGAIEPARIVVWTNLAALYCQGEQYDL